MQHETAVVPERVRIRVAGDGEIAGTLWQRTVPPIAA